MNWQPFMNKVYSRNLKQLRIEAWKSQDLNEV